VCVCVVTHTHTNCCNVLFHLVCVACSLGLVGVAAVPVYQQRHYQPNQPASNTHQCIRVCLLLFHIYIYIYIYIYMLHITHRQTSIDICLSIFSLSIHSLGSCCLHTLTPPPPPHDSRRACVCVCVCVCIWLPFEQCFRRPDNRPHIMIIIMPRTNNRRTPPLKRTTPRPIRAVLCCVVCVYWCVLLRSCRQRWTGRNTCRPAAARLLPQEQQAGMQETGTHLPTMLLLLLL